MGDVLGSFRRIVGPWRHLQAVLGASRNRLGPPGRLSEGSWGLLGLSWAVLGESGGSLGALLGRLGALLGATGAVFERSRGPLG
eukprot:9477507-Pyramimonas_sp.AAC.1